MLDKLNQIMLDLDWDEILFLFRLFTVIFIVGGILVFGIYLADKYISCPNIAKETGLETKYNFWAGGCFIKIGKDTWVSVENFYGIKEYEKTQNSIR